MGFLPQLSELNTSRDMISEFGGYNANLRISDKEFSDMKNMSGRDYPVLVPRTKRGTVRSLTKPNGLYAHEKLCWVDGTSFYYDGEAVVGLTLTDTPKTLVGMGAKIVIFPDKICFNSTDSTFENLAFSKSITMSTADRLIVGNSDIGGSYLRGTRSAAAPSNPSDGDYWVKIGGDGEPIGFYCYSSSSGIWAGVEPTYIVLQMDGIETGFNVGDSITIADSPYASLNSTHTVSALSAGQMVVTGLFNSAREVSVTSGTYSFERLVHDMEYITECNNRLWGCSSANHEIYASALGDPKNWSVFQGISTDSYAATVGTTGDFTGCCTHLGNILFFKEDCIHKVLGNRPSNFQITTITCPGVESGSAKSALAINETLFYKSRKDINAFSGTLPQIISTALGDKKYKNAVAGALGSRYYVCVEDNDGDHTLFCFDAKTMLWHKEDDVNISYFATYNGALYYIDADSNDLCVIDGDITTYADADAAYESDVEWSVTSADIGMEYPDSKYVSKLQLRIEVPEKAIARIEVQYDCDGVWVEKYRINATRKKTVSIPLIPRRCDTMKLRISGKGECKIFSITKTIEQGG